MSIGSPGPGKSSWIVLLAIMSVLVAGCKSTGLSGKPSIEITQVPEANAGGPVQMGFVDGKATPVKAGEQVILYARSGIWWVQPFVSRPYTQIQPDSTWRNSTHLGTEYAALLVEPGYHASNKLATLPAPGNGVVAVATASGNPGKPVVNKIVHFSGYDWRVRTAVSDRGGQANVYNADNAWVDDKGLLHLRIWEQNGVWSCGEVSLVRSLGNGSYVFVVRDVTHLGPSAALGLYTSDDFRVNEAPSEMDIELSRWGITDSQNAQFAVQPFYVSGNVARFTAPAGLLTYTLHWEPGRASFKAVRGSTTDPRAPAVSEHVFTTGIPIPGKETAHIDLYAYRRSKDSPLKEEEIVIERFEFFP